MKTKSIAQRRWEDYARCYNIEAKKHGLLRIPLRSVTQSSTLGQLVRGSLAQLGFMSAEEATRRRLAYYESLIEDIDPLAKMGFDHSRDQRARAKQQRSVKLDALIESILLSKQYEDYRNKELWDVVIGASGRDRLTVSEEENGRTLTWEDDDTGKCGAITFPAFEAKLSVFRKKLGTLKRPRKKLRLARLR